MFSWETRDTFYYTIRNTCNNEGLCFLRLTLGVNFLNFVRAALSAASLGTPLASMFRPLKELLVSIAVKIIIPLKIVINFYI